MNLFPSKEWPSFSVDCAPTVLDPPVRDDGARRASPNLASRRVAGKVGLTQEKKVEKCGKQDLRLRDTQRKLGDVV
jgi:hypothetical protein